MGRIILIVVDLNETILWITVDWTTFPGSPRTRRKSRIQSTETKRPRVASSIHHYVFKNSKQHVKQSQRRSRKSTSKDSNKKHIQHWLLLNQNLISLDLHVKQTLCTGPLCPTIRETAKEGYLAHAFWIVHFHLRRSHRPHVFIRQKYHPINRILFLDLSICWSPELCSFYFISSSSESNDLLPCIPVEFIAAVDWRVWSAKDSTSSKQAFTVNEATMNHEDTDLSPASIKKERSETANADRE